MIGASRAVAAAVALASAPGRAATLSPAELPGNAHTLGRGRLALHPLFRPSAVGVADRMDLQVCLACAAFGPQAGVEVAILRREDGAMSVAPAFRSDWSFEESVAGATWRVTRDAGNTALSVGLGVEVELTRVPRAEVDGIDVRTWEETEARLDLPLEVGVEIPAGDSTAFEVAASAQVARAPDGVLVGRIGASWNHAFGPRFRASLGADGWFGESPITDIDYLDEEIPPFAVFPYPSAAAWWVF